MNDRCTRAEVLAGAIALGEASAAERDEYRRHIAGCGDCLESLGGERQIERVMATIAAAREGETWEPVPVRFRERAHARAWMTGAFAVLAATAIAFGLHSAMATAVGANRDARIAVAPAASVFQVALETRPLPVAPERAAVRAPRATHAPARAAAQQQPQRVQRRRLVVVHSVITRRGEDVTQTTISTTEIADVPVPHLTAPPSNVPIWRRDEAMPRASAVSPDPVLTGRAESLSVAPVPIVREVAPVGGDAAINPRPAPIAYAENAFGTTAFEVKVDERGVPVHCAITKSSGFSSLDASVCRAAMAAKYLPRLVNGKATAGVYRDAFTFRELSDGNDGDPF